MDRKHASLSGAMARECIRLAMHSKRMRNGGLFAAGTKFAERRMHWRAPKDCTLKRFKLGGIPMEMLKVNTGFVVK